MLRSQRTFVSLYLNHQTRKRDRIYILSSIDRSISFYQNSPLWLDRLEGNLNTYVSHLFFVYLYPLNGYRELDSYEEPWQWQPFTSLARDLNPTGVGEYIYIYILRFAEHPFPLPPWMGNTLNGDLCITGHGVLDQKYLVTPRTLKEMLNFFSSFVHRLKGSTVCNSPQYIGFLYLSIQVTSFFFIE